MVSLGIDIGSEFVKSVVLNRDKVLASAVLQSNDESEIAAQRVIDQALKDVPLKPETITATGTGRKDVEEKGHILNMYEVPRPLSFNLKGSKLR